MKLRSSFSGAWLVPVALFADRVSKVLVTRSDAKPLIPGILSLYRTSNTGAAFSLFSSRQFPLMCLTAILLVALIAYLIIKADRIDRLTRAGLWLAVGGGTGNLWDRVMYGSVIDFLRCELFDFPVFNVADTCVCIGVTLVLIGTWCAERTKR